MFHNIHSNLTDGEKLARLTDRTLHEFASSLYNLSCLTDTFTIEFDDLSENVQRMCVAVLYTMNELGHILVSGQRCQLVDAVFIAAPDNAHEWYRRTMDKLHDEIVKDAVVDISIDKVSQKISDIKAVYRKDLMLDDELDDDDDGNPFDIVDLDGDEDTSI